MWTSYPVKELHPINEFIEFILNTYVVSNYSSNQILMVN